MQAMTGPHFLCLCSDVAVIENEGKRESLSASLLSEHTHKEWNFDIWSNFLLGSTLFLVFVSDIFSKDVCLIFALD